LFAAFVTGADGSITPISNIDPKMEIELFEYVKSYKYKEALELQKRGLDLITIFADDVIPLVVNLKVALNIIGICKSTTIKPLPQASEEVCKKIRNKLYKLNLL